MATRPAERGRIPDILHYSKPLKVISHPLFEDELLEYPSSSKAWGHWFFFENGAMNAKRGLAPLPKETVGMKLAAFIFSTSSDNTVPLPALEKHPRLYLILERGWLRSEGSIAPLVLFHKDAMIA